jgi:hypothetical protein
MRIYSYVIEHDLGFAPNPFSGACTLACCKPQIRKHAEIGDYVLGFGSARVRLQGLACYWMRVDEVLTFDQYWKDPRFQRKKPVTRGSRFQQLGDNIYRHNRRGEFVQADSYHSMPTGVTSVANLARDTGTTDRVLIGWEFAYWGRHAKAVPEDLSMFVHTSPAHRCRFTNEASAAFLDWVKADSRRGLIGEPAEWTLLDAKHRRARNRALKKGTANVGC